MASAPGAETYTDAHTDDEWLFGAAFGATGEEHPRGPGEHPSDGTGGNRGKLLGGLIVLLVLGVVAVGLVILVAPSVSAIGGCGGG